MPIDKQNDRGDVERRAANLWRFNSAGKALQMTEVFDTAAAAAAAPQ
jgi:hypothetical protein